MKTCRYCGRENPDEAVRCQECGTAYYFEKQDEHPAELKPLEQLASLFEFFGQPISERAKWGLYYAAWGGVILAALAMNPADVLTAPCFPIGLLAVLPNGEEKAITAWMFGPISIGIGWAFYLLLSFLIGRTRKRAAFFAVYIVFCILLALNVVGCRRTLEAVSRIH